MALETKLSAVPLYLEAGASLSLMTCNGVSRTKILFFQLSLCQTPGRTSLSFSRNRFQPTAIPLCHISKRYSSLSLPISYRICKTSDFVKPGSLQKFIVFPTAKNYPFCFGQPPHPAQPLSAATSLSYSSAGEESIQIA